MGYAWHTSSELLSCAIPVLSNELVRTMSLIDYALLFPADESREVNCESAINWFLVRC